MKRTLTHQDRHLFHEGTHAHAYLKLGGHLGTSRGNKGAYFSTWAPGASSVHVIGDWNEWSSGQQLERCSEAGLWQGFAEGARAGHRYKFRIQSDAGEVDKADPYASRTELPPRTASVLWKDRYEWNDQAWMAERGRLNPLTSPICIYEVHPGSWAKPDGQWPSWRTLGDRLIPYVLELGYTHIELLPVMEHPFFGSWGYQVSGYFAPTARYGQPDELQTFIDRCHQAGLGVILDWVPAHFPHDEFALAHFDGSPTYEHPDPRRGHHPDWGTHIFDYGRPEVRSFLISSAMQWLDRYHIDGLRFDAVASMLYLDYSRGDGEWAPNHLGGREHLEAIDFLRQITDTVRNYHPDVIMFAEESTAWPGVTASTEDGGLGFHFKWDMGWMHDTLAYLQEDPIHRQYHQNKLTFRAMYAQSERFALPLSHDEVVHGKGTLVAKCHGDDWQRRANLRLLYALQYATPGKKLLFMGQEWGQSTEWNHDTELRWDELAQPDGRALQALVRHLNQLYRELPSLHHGDHIEDGFRWIDASDASHSVICFERRASPTDETPVVCVFNFTPVTRPGYRVGVPHAGAYESLLESDDLAYGGSGILQRHVLSTESITHHGQDQSLELTLPPLGCIWLRLRTA